MRRLLAIVLVFAAVSAAAQQKRPPKLEPLPEPPPPPPIPALPGVDERRVNIPVQEGDLVEPVRMNGRVVAVKVTPPGGRPYYLIDSTGTGGWIRRESLDTGLAVPMFPILEFE
jgi:Protein of unknown function (DUF2782)